MVKHIEINAVSTVLYVYMRLMFMYNDIQANVYVTFKTKSFRFCQYLGKSPSSAMFMCSPEVYGTFEMSRHLQMCRFGLRQNLKVLNGFGMLFMCNSKAKTYS